MKNKYLSYREENTSPLLSVAMNSKLVYDFGFHNGDDTQYYLSLGYKVIAIEANPILVEKGQVRFSTEIKSGQLELLNVGISAENGECPFYISERSIWSSFSKQFAEQRNSKYEVRKIRTVKAQELFLEHGIPFYAKIDIEGSDIYVLKDLFLFNEIPDYVSVEACSMDLLEMGKALGYSRFQFVNQALIPVRYYSYSDKPNEHTFPIGSSGEFGPHLRKENWLQYDKVMRLYLNYAHDWMVTPEYQETWYDFHFGV